MAQGDLARWVVFHEPPVCDRYGFDTAGKLRLRRQGTTVSGYYWEDGEGVELAVASGAPTRTLCLA